MMLLSRGPWGPSSLQEAESGSHLGDLSELFRLVTISIAFEAKGAFSVSGVDRARKKTVTSIFAASQLSACHSDRIGHREDFDRKSACGTLAPQLSPVANLFTNRPTHVVQEGPGADVDKCIPTPAQLTDTLWRDDATEQQLVQRMVTHRREKNAQRVLEDFLVSAHFVHLFLFRMCDFDQATMAQPTGYKDSISCHKSQLTARVAVSWDTNSYD